MTDEWEFWRAQLAGLNPETTPGTPHAGYFTRRYRYTVPNPEPRPGEPRRKVKHDEQLVAIWFDDGWNCLTTGERGEWFTADADEIDAIFSQVCRNAIEHDEYEKLIAAKEAAYAY